MPDRHTGFALCTLVLTSALAAVAQDARLRFDAASIRPAAPGGPPISGTTIQGNRLRGTNVTLLALIRSVHFAEGLSPDP